MRRYAVRFIVAVLTFGLGVALSLVFGLFKFSDTKFVERNWSRKDCPKRFRVARPAFLTVDSQSTDPLRLVYLGSPDEGEGRRMRFAVGNSTEKTVSSYWITASEIWETDGKPGKKFEWTAFEILGPGETGSISLPRTAEGSSLRVARVTFQDGSIWINPRLSQ